MTATASAHFGPSRLPSAIPRARGAVVGEASTLIATSFPRLVGEMTHVHPAERNHLAEHHRNQLDTAAADHTACTNTTLAARAEHKTAVDFRNDARGFVDEAGDGALSSPTMQTKTATDEPAEKEIERPDETTTARPAETATPSLSMRLPSRSSDFKALYLKLERTLDNIERIEESTALLETVLQILVRDFRDDLGFEMGRLYRREGLDYYLCCAFGGPWPMPIGYRVPREHPPHVRTIAEGLLIMRKGDPGYDEQIASAIGGGTTLRSSPSAPATRMSWSFRWTLRSARNRSSIRSRRSVMSST